MTESHGPENRRAFSWKEANPLGWIVVLKRHPGVRRFALALVWVWFAQQALYTTWVLYTSLRYGWSPTDNGMSLAVVGISSVVVQGFLVGKLVPMLGERTAVVGGLIWLAVGFASYGAAPEGWMIYPLIALASVGGISGPALQGLVSRQVGPEEQGKVQGAMTSLTSLMGIIGPLAANAVFAWGATLSTPIPGAAFFMGAACLLIGAVLAAPLVPRRRADANKVLAES
jgi:DHA1 family tetracycline resistance protein-like MFS transporter